MTTILKGRKLAGKAWSINQPTSSGGGSASALSYTTSLSSASGTIGTPVTVTFSPNGTWANGQTITPTDPGLTGGFTAGVGGTLSGGVLVPTVGSNGPATLIFTSSAAGTGTINSTTSGGLTNTSGAQTYQAVAGGATLTDFTLAQPKPAHPQMGFNAAVGYCTPLGGIGPFRWSLSGNSNYQIDGTEARISGTGGALGTTSDVVSITCQNGRGTVVTRNVTIAKQTDNSANIFCNYSTHVSAAVNSNPQLFWASGFPVQAFDASGQYNSNSLTVTDPTGHWVSFYGSISTPNGDPTQFPPVGSYPLVCTLNNGTTTLTLDLTITVDPIVEPTIEFNPITVTAATPVGTSIGNALATTPFNTPVRAISDPSGNFKVNLTKGNVVVAQALTAGTFPVALTVSDGAATTTTTYNITVGAGVILSPGLMQMSVNPNLTNATSAIGQVIGTPTMTGGYLGGTWSFADPTGYNANATLGYFACPARLTQNANTGQITNQGPLSPALVLNSDGSLGEGPFPLAVTWTDGIHTCQQTFQVPVAWAPETVYYVGQGASTTYGAQGLETIAAARQLCQASHADTKHFKVLANTNSEYYTGDNGPNVGLTLQSWVGPVILEGIGASGIAQPRGGGPMSGALANAFGGGDAYGKGWQVFGTGDAKVINFEISGVHGGGLSDGLEGLRKDGQTYGNLQVLQCYIHDCDNGIETGVCHGSIGVDQTEIANCGTSHVSSGACHNLYVGIVSNFVMTRSTSRRATLGHMLKCRAAKAVVNASNFLATTGGQESCAMDHCNAGVVTVTNCNVQKAIMAQNENCIQYCSERDFGVPGASYLDVFPWEQNSLTVNGGNIDVMTMGGANYGTPNGVSYFRCQDPYGAWMPAPQLNGVSMYLNPAATRTWTFVAVGNTNQDTTPAYQPVETSPFTRSLPFVPTTARPFLSGTLPVMGEFRFVTEYGESYYPNFENVQQLQRLNDYQIAHNSAVGTVIDTLSATGCTFYEISGPSGAISPFGTGTTWSIVTTESEFNYGGATGTAWAPTGRYAITSSSNGTGTLTLAQTPAAAGVDYVCLRATGPAGSTSGSGASPAVSDFRYAVVLT